MPRLIAFVLCIAVLAFAGSARLGLGLLLLGGALWVGYLVVLFWHMWTGPVTRRGPLR